MCVSVWFEVCVCVETLFNKSFQGLDCKELCVLQPLMFVLQIASQITRPLRLQPPSPALIIRWFQNTQKLRL